MDQVVPELPAWVINADLEPRPDPGESFLDYVVRIGFDPSELLAELDERNLCCFANRRLAHALTRRHEREWRHFLDRYCAARIPLERRKELKRWHVDVIPESYRRLRG
jgi:hypothetical protein